MFEQSRQMFQQRRSSSQFVGQHRPLILGASIGHPRGTVGSIGPFVTLSDGGIGFMAGSYVLAPPGSVIGDWIHQPGPLDATLLTGATRIGRLAAIAPPQKDTLSRTAAAVVVLTVETSGNVVPRLAAPSPEIDRRIAGTGDAMVGDEVALLGCTSGYSRGRVVSIRQELPVAGFLFADAIEIAGEDGSFSEPGDGGALVFRCSDMMAIGLLFARNKVDDASPNATSATSFALPLQPSLDAFGATLLLH